MKRFVVLRHETPLGSLRASHWDLMFEHEGALRTWAIAAEPTVGLSLAAEQLADHRSTYLDYEGPLSGDRGNVTRWDWGEFELVAAADDESDDEFVADLHGQKLRGRLRLGRDAANPQGWSFSLSASSS